jgi:hypothetical protein
VDALSISFNNVVIEDPTPCINEVQSYDDNISVEDKEKIIMNKHIKYVHRGYRVVIDALKEECSWSDLNKLTKDVIKNVWNVKNIMPKRIRKSNSLHVLKEKKVRGGHYWPDYLVLLYFCYRLFYKTRFCEGNFV